MIRLDLAPYVVTVEDLDTARDFLILVTGAQRLVKIGRVGTRRLQVPVASAGPRTLEGLARKHAHLPVRIATPDRAPAPAAPPMPPPSKPARPLMGMPRSPRQRSPLMEHIEAPSSPEPSAAEPPTPKRPTLEDLHAHVAAAFGADEAYSIPALATELFGESTGRTVAKTRLLIEQLVARSKLERLGIATFRAVEDDQVEDQESVEDAETDGSFAVDEEGIETLGGGPMAAPFEGDV